MGFLSKIFGGKKEEPAQAAHTAPETENVASTATTGVVSETQTDTTAEPVVNESTQVDYAQDGEDLNQNL